MLTLWSDYKNTEIQFDNANKIGITSEECT